MGFYERWIVPRLLDLAMRNRVLDPYRQRTIETAQGLVLEVGVGSGLNLPLYGRAVARVVGLDPCPELLRVASRRAVDAVVPVSLLRGSAEHVPLADAAFETIVMTWTLCSIPNPMAALTEMRRVLRPGGRLIFVEHGLSPGWFGDELILRDSLVAQVREVRAAPLDRSCERPSRSEPGPSA
jgi:ubiquinone/menaquinone biosynthesis C-methylase UbiE